jgi:4-amino-4-deoxychorismate lyase
MLLLETIKFVHGKAVNLVWHQWRCNYSRWLLWQELIPLDLSVVTKKAPNTGIYRCRILYSQQKIEQVEFIAYQPKIYKSFKLVTADTIEYQLKYADRSELIALQTQQQDADDIIIIKNGLVTDSSIANLAFWNGKNWLTPRWPLLTGTTRERLLWQNKLQLADIAAHEINKFEQMAVLNALLGFKVIQNLKISF